eukprot:g73828.t1
MNNPFRVNVFARTRVNYSSSSSLHFSFQNVQLLWFLDELIDCRFCKSVSLSKFPMRAVRPLPLKTGPLHFRLPYGVLSQMMLVPFLLCTLCGNAATVPDVALRAKFIPLTQVRLQPQSDGFLLSFALRAPSLASSSSSSPLRFAIPLFPDTHSFVAGAQFTVYGHDHTVLRSIEPQPGRLYRSVRGGPALVAYVHNSPNNASAGEFDLQAFLLGPAGHVYTLQKWERVVREASRASLASFLSLPDPPAHAAAGPSGPPPFSTQDILAMQSDRIYRKQFVLYDLSAASTDLQRFAADFGQQDWQQDIIDKYSDRSGGWLFGGGAGGATSTADSADTLPADTLPADGAGPQAAARRRLLQPGPTMPQGLAEWTDCWTGQSSGAGKTLTIGLAADYGFYAATGGDDAEVLAMLNLMIAITNLVYEEQMRVRLAVAKTAIYAQPTTGKKAMDWNRAYPCGYTIQDALDSITYFRRNLEPYSAGIWHLLTDCFRPVKNQATTVGLAYIAALCNPSHGTGVTTYQGDRTWLTFAHEVGHNFGAHHSFERGQGTTGGIMDYGDGRYQGLYQFHPCRRGEMCSEIQSAIMTSHKGLCWVEANTSADQFKYKWFGAWTPCTQICGVAPQPEGVQQQRLVCVDATGTAVPSSRCSNNNKAKLAAEIRPCNRIPCSPEVCTNCTPGTCCGNNCREVVKSDQHGAVCDSKYKIDAAFRHPSTLKSYIFRGPFYTRHSVSSSGLPARVPDTTYPRRLDARDSNVNVLNNVDSDFCGVPPTFTQGIDAALVSESGDVLLFKGKEVAKFTLGLGMWAGYPKPIRDEFPDIAFPNGIDMAVSLPDGALFAKAEYYQRHYYHDDNFASPGDNDTSVLAMMQLLGNNYFTDRIDAALFLWDDTGVNVQSALVFRESMQVFVQLGLGELASEIHNISLEPGAFSSAPACPMDCAQCTPHTKDNSGAVCHTCDAGFQLSQGYPGRCEPVGTVLSMSFHSPDLVAQVMRNGNTHPDDWNRPGNIGSALHMGPLSFIEGDIHSQSEWGEGAQLSVMVQILDAREDQHYHFMTLDVDHGPDLVLQFYDPTNSTDSRDLGVELIVTIGSQSFTSAPMCRRCRQWHHVVLSVANAAITLCVDEACRSVLYMPERDASGPQYVTAVRIGSQSRNSSDAPGGVLPNPLPFLDSALLQHFSLRLAPHTPSAKQENKVYVAAAALAAVLGFFMLLEVCLRRVLIHAWESRVKAWNTQQVLLSDVALQSLGLLLAFVGLLAVIAYYVLEAIVEKKTRQADYSSVYDDETDTWTCVDMGTWESGGVDPTRVEYLAFFGAFALVVLLSFFSCCAAASRFKRWRGRAKGVAALQLGLCSSLQLSLCWGICVFSALGVLLWLSVQEPEKMNKADDQNITFFYMGQVFYLLVYVVSLFAIVLASVVKRRLAQLQLATAVAPAADHDQKTSSPPQNLIEPLVVPTRKTQSARRASKGVAQGEDVLEGVLMGQLVTDGPADPAKQADYRLFQTPTRRVPGDFASGVDSDSNPTQAAARNFASNPQSSQPHVTVEGKKVRPLSYSVRDGPVGPAEAAVEVTDRTSESASYQQHSPSRLAAPSNSEEDVVSQTVTPERGVGRYENEASEETSPHRAAEEASSE